VTSSLTPHHLITRSIEVQPRYLERARIELAARQRVRLLVDTIETPQA